MTTQENAKAILEHVGGDANITNLHHCSTRLRFSLADDSKADVAALKAIPGVLGVVKGSSQTQVVVGDRVVDTFAAIEALRGPGGQPTSPSQRAPYSWKSLGGTVMDFVVSVFTPIIPAIAGSGIFKSLLVLASALGWLDAKSDSYKLLAVIPDAVFGFIPLLVAYTSARKLKVNIPLAIGLVGVMVYPAFTALATKEGGAALFGLPVPVVAYTAQVFPAILTVLLLAVIEPLFTKLAWAPIRIFFVPMMCIVIVAPAMIFLLGPLGFWLGTLLTGAMTGLHGSLGWVAVALLAGVLPLIISVGMHKAFIPPTIATIAATGRESLYQPASLAHNLSEAGAALGVAVRTKSPALRATALSGGISALFGITEPALYGVTLQNRRAFIAVVAGAVSAGAYMGIMHVAGFVAVGPGLASITSFIDADNPQNLLHAVIGLLVAVGVSFVTAAILWRDDVSATVRQFGDVKVETPEGARILSPLTGEAIALSEVSDPVFATGVLGEGLAIRPTNGEVRSPISGVVTALLDSKHAIGIRGDDGVEVLIHVGIDTVRLGGSAFVTHVSVRDRVEAGQLLLEADLAAITNAGYDTTTPVVIVNSARFDVSPVEPHAIAAGDLLLVVNEKIKEKIDATA